MNLIEKNKKKLENLIRDSVKKSKILCNFIENKIFIEIPKGKFHGDFACNLAMVLASELKISPRKIAEIIVSNIEVKKENFIEKIEIAGPGFINFYLKIGWLFDVFELIEQGNYGKIDLGKGKKVNVEFVSANPTGAIHLGNARGGALGDSVASIFEFAGYEVTREFYINDTGNQIKNYADSLEARYLEIIKGTEFIEFPENGYKGEEVVEHAKDFFKQYGDKFLDCSQADRRKILIDYAIEKNISNLKKTLEKYRIYYDVWFRESTLYEENEVQNTINYLIEKGFTYEKEGAVWLKCTEMGGEKDEVLIRNNGIPTYLAPDIAYHKNKLEIRKFDLVIDILGADHHGHVSKIINSMKMLGIDSKKVKIIIMQLVRLVQNGETVKMSKRTGKSVTLNDLLEEINVNSIRFFFVMRNSGNHMDFDMDLAKTEDNNNPVYYVQYAHARICGILDLLKQKNIDVPQSYEIDKTKLVLNEEIEILRKLCEFPEIIKSSVELFDPSKVIKYLMEIGALFHVFYNSCRVFSEDMELTKARVKLIVSVRDVIKIILVLFKIDAPDKM
ncbi:MAG: arginine--tRNA ligase [Clostridiales bacterium]|jgi:arginyl-tRNA synthetase|nr:arginine--tRNA ligase [Clostridiales bacterium]